MGDIIGEKKVGASLKRRAMKAGVGFFSDVENGVF